MVEYVHSIKFNILAGGRNVNSRLPLCQGANKNRIKWHYTRHHVGIKDTLVDDTQ